MIFALNIAVSAVVISAASWLSGRFPGTAGFMVALPLATMLVLPLSFLEHGSRETSVQLTSERSHISAAGKSARLSIRGSNSSKRSVMTNT